jgi:hypothetical protein
MKLKLFTFTVVVAAMVAALLTGGCSSTTTKNLTPSSAKQLLEARLGKEDTLCRSNGLVVYDSQFQASWHLEDPKNYQEGRFVNDPVYRLLKAGLLTQTKLDSGYKFGWGKGPIYKYTPSPKLTGALINGPNGGQCLKIGQKHIDAVDQLFLGEVGDTAAEARYTYHVDYNDLGQVIKGIATEKRAGRAMFRKQPDGAWAIPDTARAVQW